MEGSSASSRCPGNSKSKLCERCVSVGWWGATSSLRRDGGLTVQGLLGEKKDLKLYSGSGGREANGGEIWSLLAAASSSAEASSESHLGDFFSVTAALEMCFNMDLETLSWSKISSLRGAGGSDEVHLKSLYHQIISYNLGLIADNDVSARSLCLKE